MKHLLSIFLFLLVDFRIIFPWHDTGTFRINNGGILVQSTFTIPVPPPSQYPSLKPTCSPTCLPTAQPTFFPSFQPSCHPSSQPSNSPTSPPSYYPTNQPSSRPTSRPSSQPIGCPTNQPTSIPSGCPTNQPTSMPSRFPTSQPTSLPTSRPSSQPNSCPTNLPTSRPSFQPTTNPSVQPSCGPSSQPSNRPSVQPSSLPTTPPSTQPSNQPTCQPSVLPSTQPSSQPTFEPSMQPSSQPSSVPSSQPSIQPTSQPTLQPSSQPSVQPTSQPSLCPSSQPTMMPSTQPSSLPTSQPSEFPSTQPSSFPSTQPTSFPSAQPTSLPSSQPRSLPTGLPSSQPTVTPSSQPSCFPTYQPSSQPSFQPSVAPSSQPSITPSNQPSSQPTVQPTALPSTQPTGIPSVHPSSFPSGQPSGLPTTQPSAIPSLQPSVVPSSQPSSFPTVPPTCQPTLQPTSIPSAQPASFPSARPTESPSSQPSSSPSGQPSSFPSSQPSDCPTNLPSSVPSVQPSNVPSNQPTNFPTEQPSSLPTSFPSNQPTVHPSYQPSSSPTCQPTGFPSMQPSCEPSKQPTGLPTNQPSSQPTTVPSMQPSSSPSLQPLSFPTSCPSSQPTTIPTAQPFSFPTSSPAARVYQTKGVLFWMGTTSSNNRDSTTQNDNDNDAVLGASFILFGRNFNHQSRFPFTLSLSATSSRAFISEINVNDEAGIRHDLTIRSTTIIGDINGDGFDDLLVGYPLASKCSVYFGNGEEDFSSVIANSGESFAIIGDPYDGGGFLGWSSIRIGDLNSDGFDEIIVSAIYSNTIYVIYGKREFPDRNLKIDELSAKDGFRIIGHPDEINFGVSLTLLRDFRKGGRSDLAITAQKASSGQNVIYILFGAAVFSKKSADIHIEHIMNSSSACFKIIAQPFSYAGFSLAGIDDINHDGFDDLAIGSVPYNRGSFVEQKTYVIYGRPMTVSKVNELVLSEMTEEDGFIVTGGGFLVGGAGDVNGDDIPDVMISRYDQWQGKGSSYLMVYPQNITNSPTSRPSSVPSSVPSVSPSYSPSRPVNEGTFPQNLEQTSPPTHVPTTADPTPNPSCSPSRLSLVYVNPGWPTRKPSSNVSKRPTVLPTNPKRRETPKTCPTSTPSLATTEFVSPGFQEIVVDTEGIYDLPFGNVNFIVSGEGLFEIKNNNGGGKKIYTILPAKNTVTITDFNRKYDQISLIHYPSLLSINDLVFKTSPLQIVLSSDQKVFISSLNDITDLSEDNFIFLEDSEKPDFRLDLAAVIFLGIFVVLIGIFGCVAKLNRSEETDSGEKELFSVAVTNEEKKHNDLSEVFSSDGFGSLFLSSSDSEGTDGNAFSVTDSSNMNDDERELFEYGNDWSVGKDDENETDSAQDFELETDFHFIRELMEHHYFPTTKGDDSLRSSRRSTTFTVFAPDKESENRDANIDIEANYREADDFSNIDNDILFVQQLFDN
jgi:hypothetical protein